MTGELKEMLRKKNKLMRKNRTEEAAESLENREIDHKTQ